MITIEVHNFRGCAEAKLECAPIALVAGLNAVGKSSVAQAAAAALTGNVMLGLKAAGAALLIGSGSNHASAQVSDEEGQSRVRWPEPGRLETEGKAPSASEYATSLQSIVPPMAPKDRLRTLAEYLHADPNREDLAAALAAEGLSDPRAVETIWNLIEQSGWDGAHQARRDRGVEMKAQWRAQTGANYGSRVAASWRPDLSELDEAELVREVASASAERDRAVAAEAVSDAERQRLEELADLLMPRQDARDRAKVRIAECSAELAKAQQARSALPPSERVSSLACPHCGGNLVITKVSLVESRLEKAPVTELDKTEVNRRRQAIASADGALSRADGELQQARGDAARADVAVAESVEARERLDKWPRAVETGTDRASATARLERAEERLASYRSKAEADRLHRLIEGNEIVMSVLAADGLRATKLGRVLEVFNTELEALSEAAGWQPVKIDRDGSITYGGRPYLVVQSSSEQYRVRAVLTVAMAKLDGSAMVIIDGADVLDAPSRGGLFNLLGYIGLPALVCTTLARREQVPDLAAAGVGRSYWLQAGKAEAIGKTDR